MKIMTVGASGYLGSEMLHQAKVTSNEALGTFHSEAQPGLLLFDLEDQNTWQYYG